MSEQTTSLVYPTSFYYNYCYIKMKFSPSYANLQSLKNVIKQLQSFQKAQAQGYQGQISLNSSIQKLQEIHSDLRAIVLRNTQIITAVTKTLLPSALQEKKPMIACSEYLSEPDDQEPLSRFIDCALARQKLSFFPLAIGKEDIVRQIPEALQFSQLHEQVYQRQQNYDLVKTISSNLSQLESRFSDWPQEKDCTLRSISKRLGLLLRSVDQIKSIDSRQRNLMPFAQYVKENSQIIRILSLINKSNDGLLEEELPKIKNSHLKEVVCNTVDLLRQRHKTIEEIYQSFINRSQFSRMELMCHFPRQIHSFTIDRKLHQCLKLANFSKSSSKEAETKINKNQDSLFEIKKTRKSDDDALLNSVLGRKLAESQQRIFQLQQDNLRMFEQLKQKDDKYLSLEGELKIVRDISEDLIQTNKKEILSNEIRIKEYQNQLREQKLKQSSLFSQLSNIIQQNQQINSQLQDFSTVQQQNKKLLDIISHLDQKIIKAQSLVQNQEEIIHRHIQELEGARQVIGQQEHSIQRLKILNQTMKQKREEGQVLITEWEEQKQNHQMALEQLRSQIQWYEEKINNKQLRIDRSSENSIEKSEGLQENTNEQQRISTQEIFIETLKLKLEQSENREKKLQNQIQQLNQKVRQLTKELSEKVEKEKKEEKVVKEVEEEEVEEEALNKQQNKPLKASESFIIPPLDLYSSSNIEISSQGQQQNVNLFGTLAEKPIILDDLQKLQKKKGLMLMNHSKSLSHNFNPEFTSWAVEKQVENPETIEELKKIISSKDKTLKKYEIYIFKYRSENVKYRTTILQLQTKLKKYELEVIELNELVKSIQINGEFLSLVDDNQDSGENSFENGSPENSDMEDLIEKEIDLKIKEETLNDKIEQIIKHVMSLNAFKSQNIHKKVASMLEQDPSVSGDRIAKDLFDGSIH